MARLIAVDHGVDLGQFTEQAHGILARHLTSTDEKVERYYIDQAAVAALEQKVDQSTATAFKKTVRERFEAMSPVALRDLVTAQLKPLPAELTQDERLRQLRPAFAQLVERIPATLRDDLLDVTFGIKDTAQALASLPVGRREEMLIDVFGAMPVLGSDISRTVRHNYTQLGLHFMSSPIPLDGFAGRVPGLGHDPAFTPGDGEEPPREVIGKALAATIADAAARALLLSASDEDLRTALLGAFDVGYTRRLAHFYDAEYRELLRDVLNHHHLVGELDALINRFGPSDVLVVSSEVSHTLTVDIVAGRGLIVADMRSSDPYCRLTLVDEHIAQPQVYKTAVATHTLDPVWNETWSALGTRHSVLRVEVLDRDRVTADDPMGHLEFSIADVPEGQPHDHWHLLEGVDRGELHLVLHAHRLRPLYGAGNDDLVAGPADSPAAQRADLGDPANVATGEPPHADAASLDDHND